MFYILLDPLLIYRSIGIIYIAGVGVVNANVYTWMILYAVTDNGRPHTTYLHLFLGVVAILPAYLSNILKTIVVNRFIRLVRHIKQSNDSSYTSVILLLNIIFPLPSWSLHQLEYIFNVILALGTVITYTLRTGVKTWHDVINVIM